MIYDKEAEMTYFWFSNASAIPAVVSMTLKIKEKDHLIPPLRIAPYHPKLCYFKKTATDYDFLEGKGDEEVEAILEIEVKPAYDNQEIRLCFTKKYQFDIHRKEWNESTWSCPDAPFPQQNNNTM